MTASIQFEQKGVATLLEMNGDVVTLECAFATPPGATLHGLIESNNVSVYLKVRDCRRYVQLPSHYIVRGRWVNLSCNARDQLTGSLLKHPVK